MGGFGYDLGRVARRAGRGIMDLGVAVPNAVHEGQVAVTQGVGDFFHGLTDPEQTAIPASQSALAAASSQGPRPAVRRDVGPAPSIAGPTARVSQSALGRSVMPTSIREGAFDPSSMPEWGGAGGLPVRSAMQMRRDLDAHALINAGNEQAQASIEAAGQRADPTLRQIEGGKRMAELEAYQPTGPHGRPRSRLAIEARGREFGPQRFRTPSGQPEEFGETAPTYGSALAQAAAAMKNPDDLANANLSHDRSELVMGLQALEARLKAEVAAGKTTMADAETRYAAAERKAALMADMLKGGSSAGYFKDDLGGTALPADRPPR